jgi:hypothetical protein
VRWSLFRGAISPARGSYEDALCILSEYYFRLLDAAVGLTQGCLRLLNDRQVEIPPDVACPIGSRLPHVELTFQRNRIFGEEDGVDVVREWDGCVAQLFDPLGRLEPSRPPWELLSSRTVFGLKFTGSLTEAFDPRKSTASR